MFILLIVVAGCQRHGPDPGAQRKVVVEKREAPAVAQQPAAQSPADADTKAGGTDLVVHNVVFHTASPVNLKVKWLRGMMYATSDAKPASFDELTSFRLQINEGLLGVSLADLSAFLKSGAMQGSPLTNARVVPQDGKLKITGTIKKVVPLPVSLLAAPGVAPDHHHVRLHVEKVSLLKVPMKGLLGVFSIKVQDLFDPKGQKGFTVNGNDIDIDVNQLMPPPRAEGELSEVKVWRNGDLMEYYGKPRNDAIRIKEWRNFMRLRGGTVNFGKLTMHNTDLLLVDTSPDDWLHFDAQHYQEQLVNGTTRITPTAGLQIFIPDIGKLPPSTRKSNISLQWMKNRNIDPPPDVQ